MAAVELVSPIMKATPAHRAGYAERFARCLEMGVSLVLVDIHPEPAGFSFAAAVAGRLGIASRPLAAPLAVAWRAALPPPRGWVELDIWYRPLAAGEILPVMPVPLGSVGSELIDLEATYMHAMERVNK